VLSTVAIGCWSSLHAEIEICFLLQLLRKFSVFEFSCGGNKLIKLLIKEKYNLYENVFFLKFKYLFVTIVAIKNMILYRYLSECNASIITTRTEI